jgi:hypothetical protein
VRAGQPITFASRRNLSSDARSRLTVVGTDGIATRRRLCADSCGTLEAPSFRLSWGRAGLALSPGPARVPDAPALLRGHTCTADSHGHSGSSEAISDSESVFQLAGAWTVTSGRSLESTLKVASCGAPFERRGWAAHGRPASVLADARKPGRRMPQMGLLKPASTSMAPKLLALPLPGATRSCAPARRLGY